MELPERERRVRCIAYTSEVKTEEDAREREAKPQREETERERVCLCWEICLLNHESVPCVVCDERKEQYIARDWGRVTYNFFCFYSVKLRGLLNGDYLLFFSFFLFAFVAPRFVWYSNVALLFVCPHNSWFLPCFLPFFSN